MGDVLIFFAVMAIWTGVVWLLFKVGPWISPDHGERIAGYITLASIVIGLLILFLSGGGGGLDPVDTYRR